MKLKKHILKLLFCSTLFNSIYVDSNASTIKETFSNRYQTLEGEYITIDDSADGTIDEIEIFGNTVQDPDNLEDIQSVGDLYVDEIGKPILDNRGREQYEIKIEGINSRNLLNESSFIKNKLPNGNIDNLEDNVHDGFFSQLIPIKDNKTFSFTVSNYKGVLWSSAWSFNENGKVVRKNIFDSNSVAGTKKP